MTLSRGLLGFHTTQGTTTQTCQHW